MKKIVATLFALAMLVPAKAQMTPEAVMVNFNHIIISS